MLFNSLAFAAFLTIVLPLYYALRLRGQNVLLLVASYFFYGWWDWRFLGLLAASTLVDYVVARLLGRTERQSRRKTLLLVSLAVNLGMLGVAKYLGFFVQSAAELLASLGWHVSAPVLEIVLPVGISFYTFQTIAYTYSVYRRQIDPVRSLLLFALYVAYFPQLVAGPIERAESLMPQLASARRVASDAFRSGATLALYGLFKKIAIADAIAPLVDQTFSAPAGHSPVSLLLAVYLFAIQIYCDFSGYTDVARGVSRCFGIELMLNFRQPYLATNITDFWRRWHISLSAWLREHLYVPLGGNRKGTWRTYRNLMLTMLLGGLWHGAGWCFVIWGGLHGVYLALHKAWLARASGASRQAGGHARTPGARFVHRFATFHLVCLAWIFFRAPDLATACTYLRGLLDFGAAHGAPDSRAVLAVLAYLPLVLLLDASCARKARELPVDDGTHWALRGTLHAACVVSMLWVGTSQVIPFLYFQF